MHVKPRKSPHQARAKATVDAIVEATIQVLLEDGYERFTTIRAAERAGVSIGTLYQYFPNKAALACAVVDRSCEDFLVAFESALADQPSGTLADSIHALIDVSLVSHHLTSERHRVAQALAQHVGIADRTETVSRKTAKVIGSMLQKYSGEIAPQIDLAIAATIIETVLEALVHRIKLAEPPPIHNDALAEEASRLIMRYLAIDG